MASTKLYRIDGIKLASGKQAYGSYEMSIWVPVFHRFMREVHGVNLTWIKIADMSATAVSAMTHVGGYAADLRTWSLTASKQGLLVREGTRYGLVNHRRTRGQGFDPHDHGMLEVGKWTYCSYQITATKNGRDGLARNGRDLDAALRPPQNQWLDWKRGVAAMLAILNPAPKPKVDDIPRYYTRKPWMKIPVNGWLNGLTLSRLQWQLNIKPTGKLDHYTIRALKVWLGNEDDGKGILSPLNVKQLQYRIGFRGAAQDGKWGPQTTSALQKHLNAINPS